MDVQEVLKNLDELILSQTGKQLDTLQVAILKGVLKGQKYKDIAEEYNCTPGHVKDEAYELWRTLSNALGEDVNRANVRASIEKIIIKNPRNFKSPNSFNITFCPNSIPNSKFYSPEDLELIGGKLTKKSSSANWESIIKNARKKAKLEAVPYLAKMELTAAQIAEALDLPLAEVQELMS
ncbi:MAG: hypothetical protein QQW96_00770 [Tychonema bourrellyi B0820]|uniref:vWA-MoxR associated protein N-terminal HTH domain-containing protein n=1 Tax=Tychonema bourrellyi FEM_GT703 TaxID=2040638 RepID=A0A2G4F280_9CYAN|nr:hypothetical protein [Tychonema bourrellyi]MDQ2096170.1 hypothetical protein [Tychonema bourrellyi B0820]PHX55883.1 hypothetical protein CP500_008280 [Tychonema bourrellyi FEM_GT703]